MSVIERRCGSLSFGTRTLLRSLLVEFLGTAFFLFINISTLISSGMLTRTSAPDPAEIFSIAATFGVSIALVISCTAAVSGGRINPAVTLSLVLFGYHPLLHGILYIVAQMAGASIGAWLASACLPSSLHGSLGTNSVAPLLTYGQAIALEALGTSILTFTVFSAIVDVTSKEKNGYSHNTMACLAVGGAVFSAHMILIPLTGCSINPARSFGPALVSGNWGDMAVLWIGPCIGGVCGATVYELGRVILPVFRAKPDEHGHCSNLSDAEDGLPTVTGELPLKNPKQGPKKVASYEQNVMSVDASRNATLGSSVSLTASLVGFPPTPGARNRNLYASNVAGIGAPRRTSGESKEYA